MVETKMTKRYMEYSVCLFVVTFFLVGAVSVVTFKLFDRTSPIIISRGTSFPNAIPQLPAPIATPEDSPHCVSFCTDELTGGLVPCATTKLTPCVSSVECSDCAASQPNQVITCQDPNDNNNWPTVSRDQAALNNRADKYCLPTKQACVDGVTNLVKCATDNDCIRCTDELPDGMQSTCEIVSKEAEIQICDKDGQCTIVTPPPGKYCIPALRGCNYKYGVAEWTANKGWVCKCKYPDITGGPFCDELRACQNNDVTEWSKSKQMLLLNMNAPDNDAKIGDPWTPETGVDPQKCINPAGEQVECTTDNNLPPTVACQCDGIQLGTFSTFTYDKNSSSTCKPDPCYANPNGGRTLFDTTTGTKVNQFPDIPRQPVTTCACSGYGSRLWNYTPSVSQNQGYSWLGHCDDFNIPGTNIIIRKQDSTTDDLVCKYQINSRPQDTQLVSGKSPSEGGGTFDVCSPDPCAGNYSDPLYRTEQNIGNFDYLHGICACKQTPSDACIPGQTCISTVPKNLADDCVEREEGVNPVCAYCQDACFGDLNERCPTAIGSGCGNKRCITLPSGEKQCDCGDDCFLYAGECHNKIESRCPCDGYNGVKGACATPGETCHQVTPVEWSCDWQNDGCWCHHKTPHLVCFPHNKDSCGELTCFHAPCGGNNGQASFPVCTGKNKNNSEHRE